MTSGATYLRPFDILQCLTFDLLMAFRTTTSDPLIKFRMTYLLSLTGYDTSIIFVATSLLLSQQTRICRDKTRHLSRQKNACRDKHAFVATNTCLSRQKLYLWQLPSVITCTLLRVTSDPMIKLEMNNFLPVDEIEVDLMTAVPLMKLSVTTLPPFRRWN